MGGRQRRRSTGYAASLLVVSTVEDVDAGHERLVAEGVTIVTPH